MNGPPSDGKPPAGPPTFPGNGPPSPRAPGPPAFPVGGRSRAVAGPRSTRERAVRIVGHQAGGYLIDLVIFVFVVTVLLVASATATPWTCT